MSHEDVVKSFKAGVCATLIFAAVIIALYLGTSAGG